MRNSHDPTIEMSEEVHLSLLEETDPMYIKLQNL